MAVFTEAITVSDPIGLHARPAGQLVKLAQRTQQEIKVGTNPDDLRAISGPLAILALKVKHGEKLLVQVECGNTEQSKELFAQIREILEGSR